MRVAKQVERRGEHLLTGLVVLLAIFLFSILRMYISDADPGFYIQTVFSYLGQSIIIAGLLVYLWFSGTAHLDRISIWLFALLATIVVYETAHSVGDFGAFKQDAVYNKFLQGLFVATGVLVLWKSAYEIKPNLTKRIVAAIFWAMLVANVLFIFAHILLGVGEHNRQYLNNNRASIELFSLLCAYTVFTFSGKWRVTPLIWAFFFSFVLVIVYSTRSVLVGLTLLALLMTFSSAPLKKIHRVIFIAFVAFGLFSLTDSGFSTLRKALHIGQFGFEPEKEEIADIRQVRITGLSIFIARFFGLEIEERTERITGGTRTYYVTEMSLDGISAMSRIINGVLALKSFIGHPLGVGMQQTRERTALHHGNHSLFLVALEAYGVFFLAALIPFFWLRLYRLPLIAFLPTAVVGLFFANFVWPVFLPMILGVRLKSGDSSRG